MATMPAYPSARREPHPQEPAAPHSALADARLVVAVNAVQLDDVTLERLQADARRRLGLHRGGRGDRRGGGIVAGSLQ